EGVAVADGQAPGLDRRPDPDADVDRPHEGAALAHRVTSTLNSHRDDGRLGFDGHDEATLLEWKQVARATARALRKDQERVAPSERFGALLDRRHRLLAITAIDGDEAVDIEGGLHEGKLSQFSLVEN